jgi:hypothetical protein
MVDKSGGRMRRIFFIRFFDLADRLGSMKPAEADIAFVSNA